MIVTAIKECDGYGVAGQGTRGEEAAESRSNDYHPGLGVLVHRLTL